MRLKLIAVGTRMPAWVEAGFDDYAKRLPRGDISVEMIELPLAQRGKNADIARVMEKEAEAILAAVGKQDTIIALDVLGKSWSTEQLAGELADWRMSGDNYSLLIGGPDGLAPRVLASAHKRWSLSALTLPHPLVRIVVIEQIYRAWTLLHNHPYHK
ncbi:MAG TPA: 23S rRNA (pseudouridine(1915)-N(3))-methyltransferase RlmH [Cellvibrionaceae bacterium]